MLQCHQCGENLLQNKGVHRSVQTSVTASGNGFFRTVNLCRRCDKAMSRKVRSDGVKKILFIMAAVLGLALCGLYLLYMQ